MTPSLATCLGARPSRLAACSPCQAALQTTLLVCTLRPHSTHSARTCFAFAAVQGTTEAAEVQHRLLPSQQLSAELDIQQDVLETLLSYLEVCPSVPPPQQAPCSAALVQARYA